MHWIGIDIAKHSFTAARRQGDRITTETFSMTRRGWSRCRRWAGRDAVLCLESTGPYWLRLAHWLQADGVPFAVANPRRVHQLAKASDQRSKTDRLDAGSVLRFAEVFEPRFQRPSDAHYVRLRTLSRRVLQLQQMLDIDRDRLEKHGCDPELPDAVRASHQRVQAELRGQIHDLEVHVKELVRSDALLRQQWQLLQTIPGIADKTARTLLAEYGPQIATATPKQMTRYAGLDIALHESGTSVHKRPRISKLGNWRIRRGLYMAALVAIQHNPTLRSFYLKKTSQGLQPKAALVAVMRKLIHIVYGVLKNQTPFRPQPA